MEEKVDRIVANSKGFQHIFSQLNREYGAKGATIGQAEGRKEGSYANLDQENQALRQQSDAPGSAAGHTHSVLPPVRQGAVYRHGALRQMPEAEGMTLLEMSRDYEAAAELLRVRLRELRRAISTETDPEALFRLRRRVAELSPMLTQMNQLAELTARYYERGYWRNEKYTL